MAIEQSGPPDNGGTAKSRIIHKVGALFGFMATIFLFAILGVLNEF